MTAPKPTPLTSRPAWKTLEAHARAMRDVHLRKLFATTRRAASD